VVNPAFSAEPVSYFRDVRPLLMANCNACHKPDKMKAELDMTTYTSLMKGGKHGKVVEPGDPDNSDLIDQITGDEPSMPKDADPLKAHQIELLTRWVKEGAHDDTPAPGTQKVPTPTYTVAPAVTAIAISPDGSLIAVAGYHEVLLHKSDGSGIVARLVGECARIESIAFSPDGKLLAAAGGSPAEFGQVQIWDVQAHKNLKTFQPSTDSLYGVSFSPDGKAVACGGADKVVRRINVENGKVVTEFKAHADWVLATCFTMDGKQFVSGGRDKALKLIDVETGRFVDDINNPTEQVLCMARHPKEDKVLYGGDLGGARIYKISDNQGRTAGRIDTNLLVAFERQPGPVNAVCFSPDGSRVALASTGEVKVYASGSNAAPNLVAKQKPPKDVAVKRAQAVQAKAAAAAGGAQLTLSGHGGAVFAVAWTPDGSQIISAGADGVVRIFDAESGELVKKFSPAPIGATQETSPTAAK
jgi:WD40 repeat protein